ncbi:hypothetical protein [Dactylosporangium sp. CA-233914]|uniref:hypothetical protein n=1 Tax=Dactylosporangium sp. CA-233914 TaxID=3239934 RepID=UPI003D91BF5E
MTDSLHASWAALAAMGAFHGLNPGMGWLFATAKAVQDRSRSALLRTLPPLAAGHALSVLVIAGLVSALQSVAATRTVATAGGAVLVAAGLWRALSRHDFRFRWTALSPGPLQLTAWSFLMSSIHGTGLMLVPVLVADAHHGPSLWTGLLATAVHTTAMVTVAGTVALLAYQLAGPRVLRSRWSALDRIWAVVLIGAGLATAVSAL